jgi:hypothetical protein
LKIQPDESIPNAMQISNIRPFDKISTIKGNHNPTADFQSTSKQNGRIGHPLTTGSTSPLDTLSLSSE